LAGFGKGGTILPFWEDVYGFDMQFVGQEVVHDAT
jgi:protein arginine N-methyltransferase 3